MNRAEVMAALIAAAVGIASPSSANGRFPRASMLIEDPSNPNKLTIAATYGILATEDRGQHWYYACDAAFAYQSLIVDPVAAIVDGGSLLVGTWTTIALSRNGACDFTKVFTPEIGEAASYASVDDFSVLAANRNEIVAAVTTFQKSGPNIVQLIESLDGAINWRPIGVPLPVARVHTIDVDPSNRRRIYATGFVDSTDEETPELFLRSSDRGATWSLTPIPGTSAYASAWIAGIHPTDGDKVFVRTDAWKRKDGELDRAGDALLYSADGGTTWVTLLQPGGTDRDVAGAKLLGFALSPDGSTALAGFGDPVDPTRIVDPDDTWKGIYESSSDGRFSFHRGGAEAPAPIFRGSVSCLTWTPRGVYACVAPKGEPQNVTFTTDPSFAPSSLGKLMRANEVLGPPPCCRGRAMTACAWDVDCLALGACDAGAPPTPEICDGGATADTGPSAGSRDGATSGSEDASSIGDAGGAGEGGTGGGSSGCGCRVSRSKEVREHVIPVLVATLLIAARRRKRPT